MKNLEPVSIASLIGRAILGNEIENVAAAVLAHPASKQLPRDVVLICFKVARSENQEVSDLDRDLIMALAEDVLNEEAPQ